MKLLMLNWILTQVLAIGLLARSKRLTILLAGESLGTLNPFLEIGAEVRVHS